MTIYIKPGVRPVFLSMKGKRGCRYKLQPLGKLCESAVWSVNPSIAVLYIQNSVLWRVLLSLCVIVRLNNKIAQNARYCVRSELCTQYVVILIAPFQKASATIHEILAPYVARLTATL